MRDSMLGKVFALCTDEEQAAFLNAAGAVMKGFNHAGGLGEEMQILRIVDHLDSHGRRFVKALGEAVRVDEDEPVVVKRVVYQDVIEPRPAIDAEPTT